MIDCSIPENYNAEKDRMCDYYLYCSYGCPLSVWRKSKGYSDCCFDKPHKEAVAIVQEWSDAHPRQTMKEKLFEMFPDARTDFTSNILPVWFGWCDTKACSDCKFHEKETEVCWNQPYIEKE